MTYSPKVRTTNGKMEENMRTMEKHMDDEAEKLFRNWDSNIQKREKESYIVRPVTRTVRTSTPSNLEENKPGRMALLNIERVYEKDTAIDSGEEDSLINTSSETIEEELKRPIYVIDPETGQKYVKMQFDVHGFESEDIRVKISNRKLIIFARHKENESGRKSTTEFCKKIKLPEDVNVDKLQCTFLDEVLTIEAPAKEREMPKVILSVSKDEELNTPILKDSELGTMIHVHVEVGRIFKAEDVVVKLRGTHRLLVIAERYETENKQATLSATLRREYELPHPINPASLKAGLTHDGILNVTALLQQV